MKSYQKRLIINLTKRSLCSIVKILKAYGLVIYTTTWWLLLRSSWLWIRRSGVRRKFPWVVSFNDIWWWFVFGVRYLWRHNLTSYSCFQTNVLWKFVDIIGLFFYTHSPYFRKKSSPIHFPYDKVFVKYQAQGGVLTPTPPLAYALEYATYYFQSYYVPSW